ncbi:hypothetical protein EYC84_007399 [Monilinia fructicola]|uniref:T6SS Phospholipase effector Tle1-like catalytic domain-containing protein n=1 Tax=Monilinia fructicola TaxID=38448 RepID=A0A5M9JJ36_MONFR|nr:hypothetical protein EYC84_007399 [Monilinia fructicola]
MDSDDGFTKPSLIPYKPTGTLQTPSNVTRLSRALRRYGRDGTHQIIYYHSGVGTGSTMMDTISGGMLGTETLITKTFFPELPFPHKPRDGNEYKKRLVDEGLTRVYDPNGSRIRVHAVAVWDTVGSLGIPNIALLAKLGLPHSTKEYKFHDTNLSGYIRHAFQALALDEHRRPFSPAVRFTNSDTGIWTLAEKETRTPGLYNRLDPDTGISTGVPMTHTNERIHSSVRVRLDLGGLGEEDMTKYKCPALLKKGPWRLDQIRIKITDPIPPTATWGPTAPAALDDERTSDLRWVWEYDGPEKNAPIIQTMVEENLGPYERKLLLLNKGRVKYQESLYTSSTSKRKREDHIEHPQEPCQRKLI